MTDPETGDTFIWLAGGFTHYDAAGALGIDYDKIHRKGKMTPMRWGVKSIDDLEKFFKPKK